MRISSNCIYSSKNTHDVIANRCDVHRLENIVSPYMSSAFTKITASEASTSLCLLASTPDMHRSLKRNIRFISQMLMRFMVCQLASNAMVW